MKHEEYKEMLAAAALDALDRGAGGPLYAHLAACAECRAELDELRAAAALLAYDAAPVAPTPEVRTRLLAQIKATPQTPQLGDAPATIVAPNGAPGAPASSAQNVLTFTPTVRRGLFGARPVVIYGTLAASIALLALALTSAVLWSQNRQLQRELTRVAQNLHETQQTLANVRGERDLLAAPDAHTAELAGTDAAPPAHARLTYDEQTGRAMLSAAGLPAPPPGKAYQLWFIADGKPLPGGVFTTDAAGHAELREQIPQAGRHAQIFAVTLEPQAGTSAPTGQMYLKSS
ncbi:MAG TPA: anti-sigma factor [Pyrinomonadaceae bacterium]|jgi:type II secretory pathway pseudopilin PulG|nr:anti-sigma factor [Pyrinomonadaceae bacterium]